MQGQKQKISMILNENKNRFAYVTTVGSSSVVESFMRFFCFQPLCCFLANKHVYSFCICNIIHIDLKSGHFKYLLYNVIYQVAVVLR